MINVNGGQFEDLILNGLKHTLRTELASRLDKWWEEERELILTRATKQSIEAVSAIHINHEYRDWKYEINIVTKE